MKKLSEEEFQNLTLKGKGRSSHVFNSLINLKVGEALLLEKKDWSRKASPSTLVRYIEKKHNLKFAYCAIEGGKGWAIKRLEKTQEPPQKTDGQEITPAPKAQQTTAAQPVEKQTNEKDNDNRLLLKSDIVVFYLGRMAFYKIERIDESIKACINNFWKQEPELVTTLFHEIINALAEQGHIVIENEKTYIPLRRV
jgi:hypothetical protein